MNVVGHLRPEMGLSEAARLAIRGLDAAGVPLLPMREGPTDRGDRHDLPSLPAGDARFGADLLCLNPPQLWHLLRGAGAGLPGGHAIGFWWWEIPGTLPIEWWVGFELVDEVWAASPAVAAALETMSPVPVVRVRLPVERPTAPPRPRAELGLPDGFLFLAAFDYDSNFERKNPLAVIEAFATAFPTPGEASLVVKCVNSGRHRDHHARLLAAADARPDVHVVDQLLARDDHWALVAASDCHVSLHRAEGFGLTLAEAMALGKPVIATGWSGNLEYMTESNSYLVGSSLTRVGDADPAYYPRDALWAEPNVGEAAAAMRQVVADPAAARARGRRAAADIERNHSPAAAGRTMERRLDEILSERGGRARRFALRLAPRRRRADRELLARAAELAERRRAAREAPGRQAATATLARTA